MYKHIMWYAYHNSVLSNIKLRLELKIIIYLFIWSSKKSNNKIYKYSVQISTFTYTSIHQIHKFNLIKLISI